MGRGIEELMLTNYDESASIFLLIVFVILCLLYLYHVARFKKCGFIGGLLLFIITTPLFGYFIVEILPLKKPHGCCWCGNHRNEAEHCGLCGKNEKGETRATS
jgi:hypothetical protein